MDPICLQPGERLDDVNFRLRLIQKTDGLQFGTDALLLAAYIRKNAHATAVELGGGSGIVSLLCLAREKVGRVTCVEVQERYAELIARNARLNAFADRMQALHTDVRDLCRAGEEQGKADVVFTNPPYMKTESGAPNAADEKNVARHEVHGGITDFCAAAARLLRYGGHFYGVYRPDRMVDLICALRASKLEVKRMTFVHATEADRPSMLLFDAVAGGKAGMVLTRPLILYRKNTAEEKIYTEDMQQVMDDGVLPQAGERG